MAKPKKTLRDVPMEEIYHWYLSLTPGDRKGQTYLDLLYAQFGIQITKGSWSSYFRRHKFRERLEKDVGKNASVARSLAKLNSYGPVQIDDFTSSAQLLESLNVNLTTLVEGSARAVLMMVKTLEGEDGKAATVKFSDVSMLLDSVGALMERGANARIGLVELKQAIGGMRTDNPDEAGGGAEGRGDIVQMRTFMKGRK